MNGRLISTEQLPRSRDLRWLRLYCLTGPNLQYDFLNLGTISYDGLLFPPSPLLAHQLDCYATHQHTAA